jgi:hypothetical protein
VPPPGVGFAATAGDPLLSRPVPIPDPRLAPRAAGRVEALRAAGHSISFGRGHDGRSGFFWARINPRGTVVIRTARAGDGDTLVEKLQQIAAVDPGDHLVASFSDPLRSCSRCGSEFSFDEGADVVFRCPLDHTGPGHDSVRRV